MFSLFSVLAFTLKENCNMAVFHQPHLTWGLCVGGVEKQECPFYGGDDELPHYPLRHQVTSRDME